MSTRWSGVRGMLPRSNLSSGPLLPSRYPARLVSCCAHGAQSSPRGKSWAIHGFARWRFLVRVPSPPQGYLRCVMFELGHQSKHSPPFGSRGRSRPHSKYNSVFPFSHDVCFAFVSLPPPPSSTSRSMPDPAPPTHASQTPLAQGQGVCSDRVYNE